MLRRISIGILTLAVMSLSGCASYQFGSRTLYRPDIQTIHVPIFQSQSFRKDFGERLTEAVVKEISAKTPYKVVCESDADSIVSGQIISEQKTGLAEDVNDVPGRLPRGGRGAGQRAAYRTGDGEPHRVREGTAQGP